MPDPKTAVLFTEDDYEDYEDEIASTAKGRAFLREWDRRARLVAVEEFKRYLRDQRERLTVRVVAGGGGEGGEGLTLVRRQLEEMSTVITQTRSELGNLQPNDERARPVVEAMEQLDEVVKSAELATHTILAAAETIMQLIDKLPPEADLREARDVIENLCIEILTACSFQDITGQRTAKVVSTLRYIEQRVNGMIRLWGLPKAGERATMAKLPANPFDTRPDAHLLNGPSSNGVSQDEVDSHFA